MLEPSIAGASRRLDERAAVEVMGWVSGGPDEDYWVLPYPQPGHASFIRMSRVAWRPTTDPFCLELMLEALKDLDLGVALTEGPGPARWRCGITAPDSCMEAVAVSAPTPGLAVVCAALAYVQGGHSGVVGE